MPLNLDVVPTSLDQALKMLIDGLSDEDRRYIQELPSHSIHFSSGMWLRNNWSLWDKETPLVKWFIKNLGLGHADDISGILYGMLWAAVRSGKFDLDGEVERYKKHWAMYGVDPITCERIT